MEEARLPRPDTDTWSEPTPSPEKIGGIAFRLEMPPSQPPPIEVSPVTERDPKSLVSHKKLQEKINSYKKHKIEKPQASIPEAEQTAELIEARFDSRHETIDEKTLSVPTAEGMVPIGEVLKESPVANTVPTPTPEVTPTVTLATQPQEQEQEKAPLHKYKKPLIFGTATGLAVGLALIFAYIR